jgi:hypothetical protein
MRESCKTTGPVGGEHFPDNMRNWQLLRKDPPPWSWSDLQPLANIQSNTMFFKSYVLMSFEVKNPHNLQVILKTG